MYINVNKLDQYSKIYNVLHETQINSIEVQYNINLNNV